MNAFYSTRSLDVAEDDVIQRLFYSPGLLGDSSKIGGIMVAKAREYPLPNNYAVYGCVVSSPSGVRSTAENGFRILTLKYGLWCYHTPANGPFRH